MHARTHETFNQAVPLLTSLNRSKLSHRPRRVDRLTAATSLARTLSTALVFSFNHIVELEKNIMQLVQADLLSACHREAEEESASKEEHASKMVFASIALHSDEGTSTVCGFLARTPITKSTSESSHLEKYGKIDFKL